MEKIKLFLNNLIGITGYKLSKLDRGEYTYRKDLYNRVVEKYQDLIKANILDVGSAPDSWAKRTFSQDCDVVTFDKTGNVDVQGDVLAMPFPDNTFDCVICFETIEHVEDPFRAVSEIRRILKPGGILIGSTPFMHELHGETYGDYWRITRQGWKHLLRDFKEVEVSWFGKELKPHHYLFKGIKELT